MNNQIHTELNNITSIIIASNPSKLISQVWQNFSRNYQNLFEFAYKDTFINQFGQTFRYLMESAADISLIEEYSLYEGLDKYLSVIDRYQIDKTKDEEIVLKEISKFNIGKKAEEKGWAPPANCKGKPKVGQVARVKWAFNEPASIVYSFYSNFTHFNITGLIWSNKANTSFSRQFFSIGLAQSTVILEKMVHTIGKAIESKELECYNASILQSKISKPKA